MANVFLDFGYRIHYVVTALNATYNVHCVLKWYHLKFE